MNLMNMFLQAEGTNWANWANIAFIGFMFVVVYFLILRPRQKKEKEHLNFVDKLKVGQEIVTIGGVIGKISQVKKTEGKILLQVDRGYNIAVLMDSVSAEKTLYYKKLKKEKQTASA